MLTKREVQMLDDLNRVRFCLGLFPVSEPNTGYCHSARDGDCSASECPQLRDDEPTRTGRHCPLDMHDEERGYQ